MIRFNKNLADFNLEFVFNFASKWFDAFVYF